MKALQYFGAKDLQMTDIPEPDEDRHMVAERLIEEEDDSSDSDTNE